MLDELLKGTSYKTLVERIPMAATIEITSIRAPALSTCKMSKFLHIPEFRVVMDAYA